jgi:phosphomevalonate kinase
MQVRSTASEGRVSAPGKVVIAGEYAVLEGHIAIVAAVDARAAIRWSRDIDGSRVTPDGSPQNSTLPPEVVLARRVAEASLGVISGLTLALDTEALRQGDRKYGLGSSAAGAAAAVGAVMAAHGIDPATRREALLHLAHEGHRSVAPQGSGVDVAAASLGGFLRFRRGEVSARGAEFGADIAEASPIAWPSSLVPALVWTGTPARTSELVAKVNALRAGDAKGHRAAIDAIAAEAARFAAALATADASEAIAALDAHGEAMAALGRAADAPIVTESLAAAASLARELGGAAKPSGAGGGDIAIALLPDLAARDAFFARAPSLGLQPLDVALGAEGVRLEATS